MAKRGTSRSGKSAPKVKVAKRAESKTAPTTNSPPRADSKINRLVGRKFLGVLDGMLDSLRDHHAHPNRTLLYDHIVVAHLIAFFNPALRGLRSIQELFDDATVRKTIKSPRVPRSTLADAQRLFDPELLVPLIESLQQRLGELPSSAHHQLDAITRKIIAADGSFFAVAPRIAWALYNQTSANKTARRSSDHKSPNIRKGNVRMHMQFDVLKGIPDSVGLTDGHASESQELRKRLQKECFYVMDRGFQAYQLYADIIANDSDFLVRLRKSASCNNVDLQTLTAADLEVGIVEDAHVVLGQRNDQSFDLPTLRRITICALDRDGAQKDVVLLTNRMDLPAHLIALLYQHRWQVELFFRWLKCMAHFEHFFSESRDGMTLQVYVTIIGTLLIALHTGARPSKYDYALMSCAVLGLTSIEHVRATAIKRAADKQRAAERRAARNAKEANAQSAQKNAR